MKYFISGHRDVSKEEFERTYVQEIERVLVEDPDPSFVVGDYEGVDIMAQEYLVGRGVKDLLVIYHMFEKPRHLADPFLKTVGGFKSDEERDAAMTKDSDKDIAFLRKGKRRSGTAENILRRLEVL